MKAKTVILALAAMVVFATSNVAQAVTFTVSDVQFTNLTGNAEGLLTWGVNPNSATLQSGDLSTVGSSWMFTYGFFNGSATVRTTTQNGAVQDPSESFTALFNITPPTETYDGMGAVGAVRLGNSNNSSFTVDFDNTPESISFGNNGIYTLAFNDVTGNSNTQLNLTATITLTKLEDAVITGGNNGGAGSNAINPVPEPGTIALMGLGMAALGLYRRSRRS